MTGIAQSREIHLSESRGFIFSLGLIRIVVVSGLCEGMIVK